MSKFNIGDRVWFASVQWQQDWIICPDCLGKRFLTVILGDDSQVTVDCAGCQAGYDPPRGKVTVYAYVPEVKQIKIDGRDERSNEPTEYRFNSFSGGCYTTKENQLFATEEEAKIEAERLKKESEENQEKQIAQKEKPARTWAWNATYHRGCIKRAEKDLVYHKAKLAAAETHKGTAEWKPKVTTE